MRRVVGGAAGSADGAKGNATAFKGSSRKTSLRKRSSLVRALGEGKNVPKKD